MNGESCIGILKGLLGFQKRIQIAKAYGESGKLCGKGICPEEVKQTLYMDALEEAIRCVEIVHSQESAQ